MLTNSSTFFYEIISDCLPHKSSDGENLYVLNKQFIKGYFNHNNNTFYESKHYNPTKILDAFEQRAKNIQKI